jgi:small subunit ribosomal protein S1
MKKGGGEYPPEGQGLQVRVVRVDRERGRVLLEKAALEAETWGRATQDYKVGEEVTGWVSRRTPDGLSLSIEEGVEGLIPQDYLLSLAEAPRPGAILKAVITAIDAGSRRITLRPIPPTPIPETKRKSP